jgi:hypothetical protein
MEFDQPGQQDFNNGRWKVRMTKYRSTWSWFTTNPQGGGFGSSHCGSKRVALHHATRAIPTGTAYTLMVNGRWTEQIKPVSQC